MFHGISGVNPQITMAEERRDSSSNSNSNAFEAEDDNVREATINSDGRQGAPSQAGNTARPSVNAGFNGFAFNPYSFQMQGPSGSTPDGRQAGNTTSSSVNAGFNGFAFNPSSFQMQGSSGSTPDGRQAGNTTRS